MSPWILLGDLAVVQHANYVQCKITGTAAATTSGFLVTIHWLRRLRLRHMAMFSSNFAIAICIKRWLTVKGFRSRFDCIQPLQSGQQRRSFSLLWGAQKISSVTLFKTPWPIYPPSSLLASLFGRRSSGEIRCISYSSVEMRSSVSSSALVNSGDAQRIEQLWEEYFSDPSQWWDNRADKMNSTLADFNHKAAKKALWVDGWSTPSWVKARLRSATQGRLQARASNIGTGDLDVSALRNRLPKRNNGSKNFLPTSARNVKLLVQGSGGSMKIYRASTTNEAITNLKSRLQQGIAIDSYVYVDVLKRSLQERDLSAAKQVHDCMIKSGMDKNPYVANNLLNAYIACGRLQDARRIFDELENKNVVSWTIMIGGYAKNNLPEEALKLFHRMPQEGAQPDEITCLTILKTCASPLALKWGKEVHTYTRLAGLESDVRVGTALVNMYAKCGCMTEAKRFFEELTNRNVFTWNVMLDGYATSGSIDDAIQLFDRMEKRDVISWNIMIGALAEGGRGVEAYRLFLEMKRQGLKPNAITYMSILNASASAGALEWVKGVHWHLRNAGLDSDLRVWSALVHMFAKSGSIDDARLVFDGMEKRNVITWSAMIGGLAQHGRGHEALDLFSKMRADCIKPDGRTFVAVLSACCHAGLLDEGRRLFLAMTQDYGIEPTVVHYTCMVDLLGRAGHLEEAKLLIDVMQVEPDVAAWGALLGACRIHGNVELGELAAEELLKLEPKDSSAYVLLSNIYAAAGKWEKVSLLRTVMQENGIRKEPGRSWIEVDNQIHDFFVGDTSHPEAKAIYAELNNLTGQLTAEGHIPDTQVVLTNIDEVDKQLALCPHSEMLAIVYGLMRTPPGEPIRVYKNLRVCSDCHTATKFISKVTGREIIARDANRFHHFRDGVCSCGDYW